MGRVGAVQRQVPAGFEVLSMGPGSRGGEGSVTDGRAALLLCYGGRSGGTGRATLSVDFDCETCRGIW